MLYVERLRVPLWWWLIALLLVGSLAMAILAYVPLAQGLVVVGLVAVAIALVVFGYGHTTIRVSEGTLHVGRHSIEGRWIADATPLGRKESVHAMSAGANPQDLLMTRPYISEMVRIELNDDADPHPHWMVSSRSADQLASAVAAIAVRSSGTGQPS